MEKHRMDLYDELAAALGSDEMDSHKGRLEHARQCAAAKAALRTSGHSLTELRNQALRIANEHGFRDASVGEDIALMHSELSEALEDHRTGHAPATSWEDASGKPCGIPSELADVIIRVLHFCGKHGIDIERAVLEKMNFNRSRPFKHGKVL
jgi:NTP pyrophosphatase (non-canonical NTP hydrolase)